MEDSRKDKRDGEKGISTPNPHVDGEKGKKVIVYNTEEERRMWERRKTGRIVYSQVITLEHIRG